MDTATTEYTVTGMSCGHCESSIRDEVSQLAGISDIEVSSATGLLRVAHDAQQPVDDSAIIAAVDEAGYSATRA